jgi:hypothetical protein
MRTSATTGADPGIGAGQQLGKPVEVSQHLAGGDMVYDRREALAACEAGTCGLAATAGDIAD